MANTRITDRFSVKRRIGAGTYGVVLESTDLVNNSRPVALKIFQANRQESMDYERYILGRLRRLHESRNSHIYPHAPTVQLIESFRWRGLSILVMELLGPSLFHAVEPDATLGNWLSVANIKIICCDVLDALSFLKTARIIHADVKPDNVAVRSVDTTGRIHVKLIDFGQAVEVPQHAKEVEYSTDCVPQTLSYRAPELLLLVPSYGFAVDVWSAACVICWLLRARKACSPRTLFSAADAEGVLHAVAKMLGPPPACSAFATVDLDHEKFYHGDRQADTTDQPRRLMAKLYLAEDESQLR